LPARRRQLAGGSLREIGKTLGRREQPDLAEILTGPHRAQVHLTVRRGLRALDLPGLDDV